MEASHGDQPSGQKPTQGPSEHGLAQDKQPNKGPDEIPEIALTRSGVVQHLCLPDKNGLVAIPSSITACVPAGTPPRECKVVAIGDHAFYGIRGIRSIDIPDTVRLISKGAFAEARELVDVHMPDSVTTIGPFAFDGCTSLRKIRIPDSVSDIYEGAFNNCPHLKRVSLPPSATFRRLGGSAISREDLYWDIFHGCRDTIRVHVRNATPNHVVHATGPHDTPSLAEQQERLRKGQHPAKETTTKEVVKNGTER